ncbi:MAG TPA: UDP-N-acetylmuramoyl-tripeptide--D-alanyl-D-alanine ligase [Anaerolineaceae bacterium]
MLTLDVVLEALTGTRIAAPPMIISEAAIDSRQIIPAAMFVALPGERVDGHDFIGDAFQRGATLALVQRQPSENLPVVDIRSGALPQPFMLPDGPFCLLVEDSLTAFQQVARFWRRRVSNVRVIGITGSVGKSTTKELVADVLSQRYRTLRNPGSLNNETSLPLTLLRLSPGHERAVLEMGFYVPGEIAFLCDLALPQVGLVTNIGTVHASRAGSQEAIARGKAELVQALPPASQGGVAILNYDDPWVRPMAEQTEARVFFYGLSPQAHLWADEIESFGLEGIRFRLHYGSDSFILRAPLLGQHSVHTALRAAAVGLAEGLTWEEVITGLQQGNTQLRLTAVRSAGGALILDDTYNASPESVLAALNLLSELEGRKIAVLGEMRELGQYEQQGYALVGRRVAEVAQILVTVGQTSVQIAETALESGFSRANIISVPDIPEAIDLLRGLLRPEDVCLIKGAHGMYMGRIVSALEAGR